MPSRSARCHRSSRDSVQHGPNRVFRSKSLSMTSSGIGVASDDSQDSKIDADSGFECDVTPAVVLRSDAFSGVTGADE